MIESIERMRKLVNDNLVMGLRFQMNRELNELESEIEQELSSRAERTCKLHDCEGSFSAVNKPVWRCDCGAFMTQYTDATTYHKPRFCPNCGALFKEYDELRGDAE